MAIRQATRKSAKLRLGIGGISGSGKTLGALKLAHGMTGDWKKICVIDTEHGSADCYADLGPYDVVPIDRYSPQDYIDAIAEVVDSGRYEVMIIDSISHEWNGKDGCLELVDRIAEDGGGSTFTAWREVTRAHNSFVQAWLNAPLHVIATLQKKDAYDTDRGKDGKIRPKKIGLKNIQRDGLDYEFTVLLDIALNHYCTAVKDRTQLLDGRMRFHLDEEVGRLLRDWCAADPITYGTVFDAANEQHIERVMTRLKEWRVNETCSEAILERMGGKSLKMLEAITKEVCDANGEIYQAKPEPRPRSASWGQASKRTGVSVEDHRG